MPVVARTRVVPAPPERVWDLVSDPHSLPRWWPDTERVEDASALAWTKVMKTPRGRT
ncbi:MAG: SRPBCC family protein, partial [Thermoleophilaceae bacterium]|nr:SRPBCC family protein [Thermoleophilaceae bacterium]